jgi:hypothetical protein
VLMYFESKQRIGHVDACNDFASRFPSYSTAQYGGV